MLILANINKDLYTTAIFYKSDTFKIKFNKTKFEIFFLELLFWIE